MISGEEFERRIRRVSQLRSTILRLKRAALEAYERGEIDVKPVLDVRSDNEYWRKLAIEKGVLPPESE